MFENPFLLHNKTILVTGASSGIGRQTCLTLAHLGANIIATARDAARLQKTIDLLPNAAAHTAIIADLSNEIDLKNLAEKLPTIHGVVHSAGVMKLAPFKFTNAKSLDVLMQINVYAPLFLTQQIIKQKKMAHGGSVVFIGSISGNVVGTVGHTMYATTKSALAGLTKVLAVELAAQKIRTNSLLAGMVRTELTNEMLKSLTPEQLEADEKRYPLGYGTPANVAHAVAFLLSDASQWITGTNITIDGGAAVV